MNKMNPITQQEIDNLPPPPQEWLDDMKKENKIISSKYIMTTKEILRSHPVTILRKEISKTNIKGYSKMKKNEVIELMLKAENKEKFKHIKMAESKKTASKGTHKMPDGKLMTGAVHSKSSKPVKSKPVKAKPKKAEQVKAKPNKKRQEIKEKLKLMLSQFTDQTENSGGDEFFELRNAGEFIKTLSSIKSKDKDIIELKKLVRENKYKESMEGGKLKGKEGVGWFWDMYSTNEIYHKLNAINNKY